MSDDGMNRDERREYVKWLKSIAHEGANKVHAQAAFAKPVELTDAESAAIARKRLDERSQP